MNGCLADVVAALVDGELDHAAREKAQRHLLHCDSCRAEVDVQRAGVPGPRADDTIADQRVDGHLRRGSFVIPGDDLGALARVGGSQLLANDRVQQC